MRHPCTIHTMLIGRPAWCRAVAFPTDALSGTRFSYGESELATLLSHWPSRRSASPFCQACPHCSRRPSFAPGQRSKQMCAPQLVAVHLTMVQLHTDMHVRRRTSGVVVGMRALQNAHPDSHNIVAVLVSRSRRSCAGLCMRVGSGRNVAV